ncbi:MAG: hypothetical protein QG635_1933 [Bacteroidota bacterium]|nr:hypothetical protein [Bacteroidota bacterium]
MKKYIDQMIKIRLPITIGVILFSVAITFIISKSERDSVGYEPEQPIKYSHKLHAGELKIDCQYCHTSVSKTRHAGIPSASICMNCHSVVRRDKPEIMKLVEYNNDGKPIPWKRIHRVPDYAFFNHSVHVNKGINCVHCHGDIANMDKVAQKLSFRMSSCIGCHKNAHDRMPELANQIKKGPVTCGHCHR